MFTKKGYIRVDGRMIHDMYLWEIKLGRIQISLDYLKLVKPSQENRLHALD